MFVLIWITLLSSIANLGSSDRITPYCQSTSTGYFCVSLYEKIPAEAGLCVVIPCSFDTPDRFTSKHLVWYKCDSEKTRCSDSDVIFHTGHSSKVQSGFTGRVSLLETRMSQRDCRILINDLQESDSGSYQLRVNGVIGRKTDGFTFSPRTAVSVGDLKQKPRLTVPPLTAGQQTSLTCTAPGLCSGSPPDITWTWRGRGEEAFHIIGNSTDSHIENLTDLTQRHSSNLTFTPSAEHHDTNITCKISFTGDITTEETVTLNVTYLKEVKITGDPRVKEGETLNVTCSVESFPPSVITWTKVGTENNLQNYTLTSEEQGIVSLSISNVTLNHSGLYVCSAGHGTTTMTKEMNVTVIYTREPQIIGTTTVKEGDDLNLTCRAESFPPSVIKWTKHPGSKIYVQNTGSATLFISNVTTEDSGLYICTAEHLDGNVTVSVSVTVTWFSKILTGSGCVLRSEVLTCVCLSEGFPLPSIQWPLLKDHTDYSVINTVSNHTVNSTVTIRHHGNSKVECFSSNQKGEAAENLSIQQTSTAEEQADQPQFIMSLEVIMAFLIGVLLSAAIFCLTVKCYRKKQKNSEHLDKTLEMMAGQEDPLIYEDQAVYGNQTDVQEGTENGAVAAEKVVPEHNSEPKDVEYASIDFSKLKKRSCRKAVKERENTLTEYAEIKIGVKEERRDGGKEEAGIMEGEEVKVMDEDENKTLEEQEDQVEAVYSTVKDVMETI